MGIKDAGAGRQRPEDSSTPAATAALTVASIALGTDAFVYGMAIPVLPKIATQHGARPLGIGTMFAVYAVALVVTAVAAAPWIDRRGDRGPLLVGVLGLGAATLLFAFARDPGPLIAARAAQGAAAGVAWTAGLALVARTHPPDQQGKAMGLALSCFGIGVFIGPPVGGLLAGWFDPRVPFLLATALAVADGAARWFLIPARAAVPGPQGAAIGPQRVGTGSPPAGSARQSAGAGAEAAGTGREPDEGWARTRGLDRLRALPGVAPVVLLTAVGAALIAFLEPILPLHLFTTVKDLGPGTVGVVFGIAAGVAALAPAVAGLAARRVAPGLVAAGGCALAAAGLVALGVLPDGVVPSAAALAVVVFGASLVLTPTATMVAGIAESRQPAAYGTVYALYTLAYSGGLALAPFGAGAAVQAWGFGTATRIAAGCAAVAALAVAATGRGAPAPHPAAGTRFPEDITTEFRDVK